MGWGMISSRFNYAVRGSICSAILRMLATSDGGLLVMTGQGVAGNLIARTPENWFFSGVLAKISSGGELLWKRYYQNVFGQGPNHYINDLAQAPAVDSSW